MKKRDKYRDNKEKENQKISRKKAIKKVGYAAFSAATMMLLLNDPVKGQSGSPGLPPPWDEGDWG